MPSFSRLVVACHHLSWALLHMHRMAAAPSGKCLVFAMGKGGIKRLDLDARGKVPKLNEVSGQPQHHSPPSTALTWLCLTCCTQHTLARARTHTHSI